jgi:DNA-binding response OmpR family regulator
VPAPRTPGGPMRDGRYLDVSGTTLDLSTRELHTRERVVALSEREALLLAHLMRHAGVVCSRQQILQEVWGPDQAGAGNVVDVCVARLRAKLPPDTVSTVRGTGYVFPAA